MKALLAAGPALLILSACDGLRPPAGDPVEYRPREAGTVDHAMCLLGFSAVPLRELQTGHHVVDATLNGREGAFVLDTGANATVLHTAYARRFGITDQVASPAAAIGLGGAMQASIGTIERLQIGSVPVRQSRIMVTDLAQLTNLLGPMAGSPIYGIIGQDVLSEHRAVIDVARPILYLMEADEDPAPVAAGRCSTPSSPGAKTDGNRSAVPDPG